MGMGGSVDGRHGKWGDYLSNGGGERWGRGGWIAFRVSPFAVGGEETSENSQEQGSDGSLEKPGWTRLRGLVRSERNARCIA